MTHRNYRFTWVLTTAAAAAMALVSSASLSAIAGDGPQEKPVAEGKPAEKKPEKPKPKFTISKETTYITEPLTDDGYPDYAAALNGHYGNGVTSENNANVRFWRAHGPRHQGARIPQEFFRLLGLEALPEKGDYFVPFGGFVRDHLGIPEADDRFEALKRQQTEASRRPWKPEDHPEVDRWLALNEKPLALVVAGTECPEFFSPVVLDGCGARRGDVPLITHPAQGADQAREAARALVCRAMLNVADAQPQRAWHDLLTCYRLGRLIGRGPLLLDWLAGVGIESQAAESIAAFVQHVRPDKDDAARYARDLHDLPPLADLAERYDLADRFVFLDSVILLAREGDTAVADFTRVPIPPRVAEIPTEWDAVLRMGNQWHDRIVTALREPRPALRHRKLSFVEGRLAILVYELIGDSLASVAFGTDASQLKTRMMGRLLVAHLLTPFVSTDGAAVRAVQQQSNLAVALALSAYHRDHGRFPPALADLSPQYLQSVPGDIFTGGKLIYAASKEGCRFYSLGLNRRDDKGRSHEDDPQADDVGVRFVTARGN
ncbi:MAG: hypothetical protein HYS13_02350 [Planctomycetia bacterium]|nr:hypothetical protein [Planctomycetia bacterium]